MAKLELLFEFRGSRRCMVVKHSNVCEVIEQELKWFGNICCSKHIDAGHTMSQSDVQDVDGDTSIHLRGCVYLCDKFEVRVGSANMAGSAA